MSVENLAMFKFMISAVTSQNSIREEIKRRHAARNLLSKNVKIKVYKTISLP